MKLDAGAIVVGAGLAGLVATSELAAAGREVRTVCSIRRPAPAPASPT